MSVKLMRALQISRYGERLKVKDVAIPTITDRSQQLLIRIHYAPINPSDVLYTKGVYGLRHALPTIGGFEGCGVIVDGGEDPSLTGKRVMCWSDDSINSGTWGEYFLANKRNTIILQGQPSEGVDFSRFSSPFINPMTALGFLHHARNAKASCAVFNAANSAVARMSIQLFKRENIETIAIVRNKDQIENLLEIGATTVLDSSAEGFTKDVATSIRKHNANVFFDAVGGDHSGLIFKHLANQGRMYVYGKLSLAGISDIDPVEMVFKGKQIAGFWLPEWLKTQSESEINALKQHVEREISSSLATRIQSVSVPTDANVNDIIRQAFYSSSNGKHILDFIH